MTSAATEPSPRWSRLPPELNVTVTLGGPAVGEGNSEPSPLSERQRF